MRTAAHWEKIGFRPHHGFCVPLSALRSKISCGIGEFLDLRLLIDFCSAAGFDTIQLLPINDTGDDPSPYNPISSFALDPVYLSLAMLPRAKDLPKISPHLPFYEIKQIKLSWLYNYFLQMFASVSKEAQYQKFLQDNPWLGNYSLFKSLKAFYESKHWQEWPPDSQTPTREDAAKHSERCDFYCFLQFYCFAQMQSVRAYAEERRVFLKGDIPILLSPDSADVWAHREIFRLDLAAGSPPDYYNPLGQHWGFPLFNWEVIKREQFGFWKKRLAVASRLFHIYRIDHVVGLFRIWAIPKGALPKEGFFIPEDPHSWPAHGREILEMMIDASPLLPIAEDLGTIPREVPIILKELGICGTKVVRWQKYWDGDKSYIPLSNYEPLSMTTVSTPDSDTLQMWWMKYPDEAIPFAAIKHWTYNPQLTKNQRLELLRDAHRTPSYFHINLLQEYLALFPELVSSNPEEERINIPGTVLPTNWAYRFRPSLEEMLAHKALVTTLNNLSH